MTTCSLYNKLPKLHSKYGKHNTWKLVISKSEEHNRQNVNWQVSQFSLSQILPQPLPPKCNTKLQKKKAGHLLV